MIWPLWVIQIIVSIVLAVAAYLLTPKPKSPTPEASKDLDAPTADASRAVGVPFGNITLKSPNCLWYGDVGQRTFEVSA